jgi:hypothetical protein
MLNELYLPGSINKLLHPQLPDEQEKDKSGRGFKKLKWRVSEMLRVKMNNHSSSKCIYKLKIRALAGYQAHEEVINPPLLLIRSLLKLSSISPFVPKKVKF